MCTFERRRDDLRQMHVFGIFPWRDGAKKKKAERVEAQVGSCLWNPEFHFLLSMLSVFFPV